MANVKVFADKQTDKWTGQKLYASNLLMQGHKKPGKNCVKGSSLDNVQLAKVEEHIYRNHIDMRQCRKFLPCTLAAKDVDNDKSITKSQSFLNPYPDKPWFLCICITSL